ncbi:MAG: transcription antitermination factor NusB [Planctomycetota bacterium]|nr:MAG: transcription antitermination factor NusB [Planctomycetota bacterium]
MKNRRLAREIALKELYRLDLLQETPPPNYPILPNLNEYELPLSPSSRQKIQSFASQLITGYFQHKNEINTTLSRFLQNWKLHRTPIIDRNILRIATFEMLFLDEIPLKVSINEAVELAKRYGSKESSSFVNGVLDKIKQELEKQIPPIPQKIIAPPSTSNSNPNT